MHIGLAAVAVVMAVGSVVGDVPSKGMVEHRRAVRSVLDVSSVTADAIAPYLKDEDPGVRRFALFKLHEKDMAKGRETAKRLSSDPDDAVKALAKELLRNRNAAKSVSMELPLSQGGRSRVI